MEKSATFLGWEAFTPHYITEYFLNALSILVRIRDLFFIYDRISSHFKTRHIDIETLFMGLSMALPIVLTKENCVKRLISCFECLFHYLF